MRRHRAVAHDPRVSACAHLAQAPSRGQLVGLPHAPPQQCELQVPVSVPMPALHAFPPSQVTSHVDDRHSTAYIGPISHAFPPRHVTSQVSAVLQSTPPFLHALSPRHCTVQAVAPPQSTPFSQPSPEHDTRHGMPFGHRGRSDLTAVSMRHTPSRHAPFAPAHVASTHAAWPLPASSVPAYGGLEKHAATSPAIIATPSAALIASTRPRSHRLREPPPSSRGVQDDPGTPWHPARIHRPRPRRRRRTSRS